MGARSGWRACGRWGFRGGVSVWPQACAAVRPGGAIGLKFARIMATFYSCSTHRKEVIQCRVGFLCGRRRLDRIGGLWGNLWDFADRSGVSPGVTRPRTFHGGPRKRPFSVYTGRANGFLQFTQAAPAVFFCFWGYFIPQFDGANLSPEWKHALWARFCMGSPQRQRRPAAQFKTAKRV